MDTFNLMVQDDDEIDERERPLDTFNLTALDQDENDRQMLAGTGGGPIIRNEANYHSAVDLTLLDYYTD